MPEMTIDQAMQLAVEHHRSGRLADAEAIYRQVLAVAPQHPDALHLLGVIAQQAGKPDAAIELIRRALAVRPAFAEAWCNLGIALKDHGQLNDAIAAYRKAIDLRPNYPVAHSNLGLALKDRGNLNDAIAECDTAVAQQPDFADAHNNRGLALAAAGRLDEAIAAYQKAIALKPDFASAHHNLGVALFDHGQPDEAIAAYRRALAINPNDAHVHYNLAVALKSLGHLDDSIASLGEAIRCKPNYPEAHSNLGLAQAARGRLDDAVASFRAAIALNPDLPETFANLGSALFARHQPADALEALRTAIQLNSNYAPAHINLGNVLQSQGQLDEALAAYQRAIDLDPSSADAPTNYGNALAAAGRLEESIAAHRLARERQPGDAAAHSNLLLAFLYQRGDDSVTIAAEARRWNDQHARPLERFIRPHDNDRRSPDRRLKIGYVSADFREHSVAYFLQPLLAHHDPEQFEIFAYADVATPDAVTAQLQSHVHHWRSIVGLSDEQVAEQIRRDRIAILIDLAGHTSHNRLLVFARKPAPIQMTYLGYPATTGLATIDYRITDTYADPPQEADRAEQDHTEKLLRLTPTAWCYSKPHAAPDVTPRPPGPLTFGCFNNFAKITDAMLQQWGTILAAVPRSRLLLKSASLASASVRERVLKIFNKAGVSSDRINLLPRDPAHTHHVARYHQIDIALDTYPYHGTTTTCEALYMAVPVITRAGPAHLSRVGVSLLTSVGLQDLIATSPDHYTQLAIALANDRPRLADLRATLRPRMEASALMNAPHLARSIESAYRDAWKTWSRST